MKRVWIFVLLCCDLCFNLNISEEFSDYGYDDLVTETSETTLDQLSTTTVKDPTIYSSTKETVTTPSSLPLSSSSIDILSSATTEEDPPSSTTTKSNTNEYSTSVSSSSLSSSIETSEGTITPSPVVFSCDVPELTYNNFYVHWTINNSTKTCSPSTINFICSTIKNQEKINPITFNISDVTKWNINTLEKGLQYSCKAHLSNKNGTQISEETSLTIPPGSIAINATLNDLSIAWEAPVVNQTLHYNVIVELKSNHYIPDDCDVCVRNVTTYQTNDTNFEIRNFSPDYMYNVVVGVEFWGFNIRSEDLSTITPTTVPGKPRDVSIKRSLLYYTLEWKTPCDSNGEIDKYFYTIKDLNSDNIIERKTVVYRNHIDNYSVNLTHLALNTSYEIEAFTIGNDNRPSEPYKLTFTTDEDGPKILMNISSVTSTSFMVNWSVENLTKADVNMTFSINIDSLNALYERPKHCPVISGYRGDLNDTFLLYNAAQPFYIYNVTVTAYIVDFNVSISADKLVSTSYDEPAAPENFTLYTNNDTLESRLTWNLPCDINGNFSGYYLVISETYTEDREENIKNHSLKEPSYNLTLKPSHIYVFNVAVVISNYVIGKNATKENQTPVGLPGVPNITNLEVNSTFFNIHWSPPTSKTGPILDYEINITSLEANYTIPKRCEPLINQYITKTSNRSYYYNQAFPDNQYRVDVKARTLKGYGQSDTRTFITNIGVPENVEYVTVNITNIPNEVYNASANIWFTPPCYSYGNIKDYILEYNGVRNSYVNDIGMIIYEPNVTNFSIKLKPEYTYIYKIKIRNEKFENESVGSFVAPAGVPSISSNISIPIVKLNTDKVQFTLRKEYFSGLNGDVKYFALILNEGAAPNFTYGEWNSKYWPEAKEGVQLTQPFWNPFNINNTEEVTFTLGGDTSCSSGFCNHLIKDDTIYYLTVRAFTINYYGNSAPIYFKTDPNKNLSFILAIVLSLLAILLIAFICFIIWKKKLYKKYFNIYPRKSSAKPLSESSTSIPAKKFIQYFKNSQNKPDFLKEQFNQLSELTKEIEAEKSTYFATLAENKRKNRYVNISPYDDTRVKLLIDEDDEIGSDYINASFVKGNSGSVEYIATQGPLPSTCRDFWKMVIQENVTIIVMVSQFIEKNRQKCHKYFPKNHENLIISEDMEVRCSTELHFGTYLVRNLQVRKDSLQVTVTHMQFMEWPDFNVPTGTEHMLQFIYQIRERLKMEGGIAIVHCSAGVGRTGTLIAADILIQNANAGKQIDVFNTVLELRKQRVMMVQTVEQYVYLHQLVADHIDRPPTPDLIEATEPVYENMNMLKNQSGDQSNSNRKEEESKF